MGVIKKGQTGDMEISDYDYSIKKEDKKRDPKAMKRAIEAKQRVIKKDRFTLNPKPQVIVKDPSKPKPIIKPRTKDGRLVGIDITCTCGEKIRVNFDFGH